MSSNSNQTMSAADPTGLLKRSDLENEYKIEIKQNIDRFGEVLVLKNAEGHRIMAKEKRPSTIEDCKRDVHQAFERLKLNHPHLLRMYDYSVMREDDHFVIRGYYELADANLAIELEQRREDKAYFAAEELRNLLVDILEIVTYLKEKKMIHGDIRPEYVMFDGESQIYKLADRLGDPSPPTKVQAKNIIRGRKLYLSPQLFFNLVHQTRGTPNFEAVRLNPYLSEGYSIGLLILEAGLLEDCQSIYDLELGQIDESVLQTRLAHFADQYQDQDVGLVRAVQDLLETSEEERPDLHLLLTGLKSTPQNSDNEEEPENMIFNSDRDRQGGVIEEVEEEDDQSTQQAAIHSSFRQTKITEDGQFQEDANIRGVKSPNSGVLTEKSGNFDQKNNMINEFTSGAQNIASHKQSFREDMKVPQAVAQVQIKDSGLAESGFDLILKEDSKVMNNKSDSFSYDPLKHLSSKENLDIRGKAMNFNTKESKPDSKNETKTNSISHEVHSDGHSSLKQGSREENKNFENKQNLANNRVAQEAGFKEGSFQENISTKQNTNRNQTAKVDEDQDWERNLAEIKFQRDEVIQGLQSLKNIHQDFYRSEDHQQPQENKHVPNIFKDEFASGQSLHQLIPNQNLHNKSEYESNTLDQPKEKDIADPVLKREGESQPLLSTNQTSNVMSKATSGQQLIPLALLEETRPEDSQRSKFDYQKDKYAVQSELFQSVEANDAPNHNQQISSTGISHSEAEKSNKNLTQTPTLIASTQQVVSRIEPIVTPNRQELVIQKKGITNDFIPGESALHHHETTPNQKPIFKTYEGSTQFKAVEETPKATRIGEVGTRLVVEGITRTTPFTTLKPGDVLINSNQKINPNNEFSSNISRPDVRTDSTPVRELQHPSAKTETRELSSFNASSFHETNEKRAQPHFYNENLSPLVLKNDPQIELNFRKEVHPAPPRTILTPSASHTSLHRHYIEPSRDLTTTKTSEFQFKTVERQIHPREVFVPSTPVHAPIIQRDVSPRVPAVINSQLSQSKVHNPIVVLSQNRQEEYKPIVIRSRSTTPIKNSMQSIAGVAEGVAQALGSFAGQPTLMKTSQTISTSSLDSRQNLFQEGKGKELEAIFQTGLNAPAYKGLPPSRARELYETATRVAVPEATISRTASQSYLQNPPQASMTSSTYLPPQVYHQPTTTHASAYLSSQQILPQQPAIGARHVMNTPLQSSANRSVSPLQSSLFRNPQENEKQHVFGQQSHHSHQQMGYVSTTSFSSAFATGQPVHRTTMIQTTPRLLEDQTGRGRTPPPTAAPHFIQHLHRPGFDSNQGYFAVSRHY